MRTTLSPAFRSMLIFSTELVFGPRNASQQVSSNPFLGRTCKRTNCADDGCTAIIGLRFELGVQAREPFNSSSSRGQVIKGVGHVVGSYARLLSVPVRSFVQKGEKEQ